MIIKKIKLNNIRSYTTQEINFPEGSVLLSGDIGSGKSSILLSLEFALFGLKRKELAGSTLLRHGKNQGFVEVTFQIDGKEVVVKRTLKRQKSGITQDSGYIIINGKKTEGTHVEIKAKILDLLGYPKELVTKSRDLVYRYTVYTPQEQMKQILTEDAEERLDTLRRVFGIDKYKRIRESTQIYVKELKSQIKMQSMKTEGLQEKQNQRKELEHDLEETKTKIGEILPKIKKVKEEISRKESLLKESEKKLEKMHKLRRKLEVNKANVSSAVSENK
ncbi:SMC family ATPase, partial [Candidatus Woesearchaeota archaeon]